MQASQQNLNFADLQKTNIGEIHYHKENKTNGGKQIEFSAESNQFKKYKILILHLVVIKTIFT